jgi:membrane protein implicated in regulation of membrane protease activity
MQLWSWALMAVGVTGLFLAGRGGWLGWAIGIFAQLLWFVYALVTKQYGFIVSAIAYGVVNVINLRKALKRQREADTKE